MDIHDNYIQGGWAVDPTESDARHYSGSALTTDGFNQTDPNLTTSFIRIHHNQAVGFGNAGIGIALGHDIEMYANRAISSGQFSNGVNYTTSYAAGVSHWNYRNNPAGVFGNNSVHDNVSGMRRSRNGVWERFDYFLRVTPTVNTNNTRANPATAAAPTAADETNETLLWREKLASRGITVGSLLVSPPPIGSPLITTNLTASSSAFTVTLRWTAPLTGPLPTTYAIEAGSSPGVTDIGNVPTGSTATAFSASGIAPGTYYVRIRGANSIGAGPASNEAMLVIPAGGGCAPGAPTGLTATVRGGTVTLSWTGSSGSPTSYVVEAGSNPGAANLAASDLGSAAATLTASEVGRGIYYVRVFGKNACGAGPVSNEILVTVP
jgi:hypothetical protein